MKLTWPLVIFTAVANVARYSMREVIGNLFNFTVEILMDGGSFLGCDLAFHVDAGIEHVLHAFHCYRVYMLLIL